MDNCSLFKWGRKWDLGRIYTKTMIQTSRCACRLQKYVFSTIAPMVALKQSSSSSCGMGVVEDDARTWMCFVGERHRLSELRVMLAKDVRCFPFSSWKSSLRIQVRWGILLLKSFMDVEFCQTLPATVALNLYVFSDCYKHICFLVFSVSMMDDRGWLSNVEPLVNSYSKSSWL